MPIFFLARSDRIDHPSCCLYAPRTAGVPQLSLGQKAILRCTPDYVCPNAHSALTFTEIPLCRHTALVASRPSFPPTRISRSKCSYLVSTDHLHRMLSHPASPTADLFPLALVFKLPFLIGLRGGEVFARSPGVAVGL